MRRKMLAVLVVGLLVAADEGKKEGEKFSGTWTIESFTRDGKDNDDAKGEKVTFEGDRLTVETKNGEHKGTFKLYPDQKPKGIDFTPSDGPNEGKMHRGIYALEKGRLKICLAKPDGDRPKEFESKEGSDLILVVLKREKSE